jgi:hypothetical protein
MATVSEREVGFADFAAIRGVIPAAGARVYTIWDERESLVYVGVARRNPAGKCLSSRARRTVTAGSS